MRKQVIALLVVAVLCVAGGALVWFQGRQPSAAPTQPSYPVVHEAGNTAPSAVAHAAAVTPLAVAPGVELAVPVGWSYVHGEGLALNAAGFADGELLLLLWRAGPSFGEAPVRASLVRIPRADLDVPGYLAGLRAELTAAGLAVEPPVLTARLRNDELPAGQLTYRKMAPDGTGQVGVQYVFVDGGGENLVAISFAATAGGASGVAGDWVSLVRSLQLEDVS